ncbi:MAG: hypothetical protein ACFFD4_16720 [Candidatus Odinarchaeota archaeon]
MADRTPLGTFPKRKYDILIKLQEDPLAPALKIADAVNKLHPGESKKLSPTTVINTLSWLKENNAFTEVHSVFKHEALDLKLIDVLIQPTSFEAIKLLETAKKDEKGEFWHFPHPYISYHARINGAYDGLFCQFRIPANSILLFNEYMKALIEREIISKYEVLEREPGISAYTKADLNAWEPDEYRWNFKGKQWISGYNSKKYPFKRVEPPESILQRLDEIDILLLAELSRDARRKNKEIGITVKKALQGRSSNKNIPFELASQDLSRRLKTLKKEAIDRFRLFLNWKIFDIYNTAFFTCKARRSVTESVAGYLKSGTINFPFESVFSGLKDGFYWYMRAPSNAISQVIELLWQETDSRAMSLIDYRSSKVYDLWSEVYNTETKYWRDDYQFMVEEPLKIIDSQKF